MFSFFYAQNSWGGSESRSGGGSSLEQTKTIRLELPKIFEHFGITTLLDVPCGDGHWWRGVDHALKSYIGADVVPEIVDIRRASARTGEHFLRLDIACDELPRADAVLCRDLFVHFSEKLIADSLRQLRGSGSTYLIATTFPGRTNRDIDTGGWRPIDLTAPPFKFPEPLSLINENCSELGGRFSDKSLGVWRLADISD